MFGSIGGPELILIFLVALLIFGPRKLPELGRALGKGMSEFRRAANDLRVSLETEVAREAPPRTAESGTAPAQLSPAPGALARSGGQPGAGSEGAAPAVQATDADGTNALGAADPQTSVIAPAAAESPSPAAAPDARDTDRAR